MDLHCSKWNRSDHNCTNQNLGNLSDTDPAVLGNSKSRDRMRDMMDCTLRYFQNNLSGMGQNSDMLRYKHNHCCKAQFHFQPRPNSRSKWNLCSLHMLMPLPNLQRQQCLPDIAGHSTTHTRKYDRQYLQYFGNTAFECNFRRLNLRNPSRDLCIVCKSNKICEYRKHPHNILLDMQDFSCIAVCCMYWGLLD